jgi:hypothetical protein
MLKIKHSRFRHSDEMAVLGSSKFLKKLTTLKFV